MPEVSPDVPLAPSTTLGLGGPARRAVSARTAEEIVSAVLSAGDEPVLVLAGGSNVVVADAGYPGLAVLIRSAGWSVSGQDGPAVELRVEAGQDWDELVAYTVAEGLAGIECLSGVPGSAGATPIQNVGAYGQDVAEVITGVTVLDRHTGAVVEMTAAECEFAYRASRFKHSDRWVVLSVGFRLHRSTTSTPIRYAELARAVGVEQGGVAPLKTVRDTVLALRRGKGMVLDPADPDTRSVGSFFVNPVLSAGAYAHLVERLDGREPPSWPDGDVVKISAAWLIEHAGFVKGYARPGAAISGKHTLALSSRGGTTADLLALAREV
ncbi:MAG: UDP-N-acetylmuramate dehydrogenase, partial [Catenulispora sp.]|nr:UDP-N-acetylmuramate dehydrogenase [Catenulispora sp.]